jgi:glucose/arabinose dehydrogenase
MTEFRKGVAYSALLVGMLMATGSSSAARDEHSTAQTPAAPCADDNGGITLPAGFCASVFADNVGHARHLVVAPNGVVYVNTWSRRYYGNDTPPPGPTSTSASAPVSRAAAPAARVSRSTGHRSEH